MRVYLHRCVFLQIPSYIRLFVFLHWVITDLKPQGELFLKIADTLYESYDLVNPQHYHPYEILSSLVLYAAFYPA